MTLIMGYILNNTTYIVADSALTNTDYLISQSGGSPQKYTAFGDLIDYAKDEVVTDGGQKIIVINNSLICTYAGSLTEANTILEDLDVRIKIYNSTPISEILITFFEEHSPKETNYIIAFHENGVSKMFWYEHYGEVIEKNGTYVVLGTGNENSLFREPLKISLNDIASKSYPPDVFLVHLVSLMQCLSINALSFNEGVGGHFNGAYTNQKGINWLSDICYIVYSSHNIEKSPMLPVKIYNRDSATIVTSPMNIHWQVLFPKATFIPMTLDQWLHMWHKNLLETHRVLKSPYYVFIGNDRRVIVIVNSSINNLDSYLELAERNFSLVPIMLEEPLVNELLSYAINPETGQEDNFGIGTYISYIGPRPTHN